MKALVTGAVVAIQTFGDFFWVSSPSAYPGFKRLLPRKQYVFRFSGSRFQSLEADIQA